MEKSLWHTGSILFVFKGRLGGGGGSDGVFGVTF